jgi:hypothetical protein
MSENYEGKTFQWLMRRKVPQAAWPPEARLAYSRYNATSMAQNTPRQRRAIQNSHLTFWRAVDTGTRSEGRAGLVSGLTRLELIAQRARKGT